MTILQAPAVQPSHRTSSTGNGRIASGPTFPVYNPLNDELVAEAAAGTAADAEAAVAAAAAAFPAWANAGPGRAAGALPQGGRHRRTPTRGARAL